VHCTNCNAELPAGASFCAECGTRLETFENAGDDPVRQTTATQEPARDNLVYPRNPPQSPHLALLSIFLPGVPQLFFGQIAKGITVLVVTLVLYSSIVLSVFGPVLTIAAIVDGYMVGNRLYSGRTVEKWQFFPRG